MHLSKLLLTSVWTITVFGRPSVRQPEEEQQLTQRDPGQASQLLSVASASLAVLGVAISGGTLFLQSRINSEVEARFRRLTSQIENLKKDRELAGQWEKVHSADVEKRLQSLEQERDALKVKFQFTEFKNEEQSRKFQDVLTQMNENDPDLVKCLWSRMHNLGVCVNLPLSIS